MMKEKYGHTGYVVKNLLIQKYHIEKHFCLLRHLFMFKDDLIFPLYRKLFMKVM